ncbi:hypothetical protein E2C01_066736 [Portunus trituberculatus]|uniref:Uncharacterized protein n=1 Tax=Portunus trituberculatus TaxID=210409 RepID=A0A5B7HMC3_PORTR|nr:hypothetical protein [Portunus trituberculatus]
MANSDVRSREMLEGSEPGLKRLENYVAGLVQTMNESKEETSTMGVRMDKIASEMKQETSKFVKQEMSEMKQETSGAAMVQWNHACFGVRGVSKRTGSNPVHSPSVDWASSLWATVS